MKTIKQAIRDKMLVPFGKRLSTGKEQRRFKGTLATNTIDQRTTAQSDVVAQPAKITIQEKP